MNSPLIPRVRAMWLSSWRVPWCTIPYIMKQHTGCAWVVWSRKSFRRKRLPPGLRQAAVARAAPVVIPIIAQTAVVHPEVPDHPPILLAAHPAAHPAAVAEINEGGHRMTVKFHLERDDAGLRGLSALRIAGEGHVLIICNNYCCLVRRYFDEYLSST